MVYDDLLEIAKAAIPGQDFVLMAESFSTPLAVRLAAESPPNLRGVILCAGYCDAPVRGVRRWIVESLGSWMFRSTAPAWIIEWLLTGNNPPAGLVEDIRRAVAWVEPKVMAIRLHETLRCNVRQDLLKITAPILAILPGHDRVISPLCVEEMLATRPFPTITIDGPHLLLQREPVLCAEVVMSFLRNPWNDDARIDSSTPFIRSDRRL